LTPYSGHQRYQSGSGLISSRSSASLAFWLVATGIAFLTGSIQDFSAWLLQSFPGLANLG